MMKPTIRAIDTLSVEVKSTGGRVIWASVWAPPFITPMMPAGIPPYSACPLQLMTSSHLQMTNGHLYWRRISKPQENHHGYK